mgnify:CR=1 FL=1|jgi:hypothetical protein
MPLPSDHSRSSSAPALPSLMDDIPVPAAAARNGARSGPPRRDVLRERLAAGAARLREFLRTRTGRRVAIAAAAVLLIGGGIGLTVALWPRPVPDYLNDPLDEILDFTLLTDDFNTLPIEQRLALIKDLVHRLKNASAEDSILMAAFAASIRDKARKQLEANAQRLALDMLDNYAIGYHDVPPEDRAEYLDRTVIEFTRLMEDISGERSGLSEDPNERLAQIKRQAKRDQERMGRNAGPMRADRVSGFLGFLNDGPGELTDPAQQARMTRFTRDMIRHLRGQDLSTGAPKGGG